jgi:hypothetical protein
MHEIIERYLAGEGRLVDPFAWVDEQI